MSMRWSSSISERKRQPVTPCIRVNTQKRWAQADLGREKMLSVLIDNERGFYLEHERHQA
jgi:hypothetical protein